ncbi:class I SAM-dependent methyltransferase [Cytobacillus purgationiresistens]|uniref:Ubiquinone/menaquinone biosynthesis C-methylase UbiE n=1 Tax=Cytobacillus purgationiresistens TaxID=863449 RepID=A0ABU0AKZ6_9BACI|nr:class I SAM-dependent methyltransferase [Cytobacillus purgationiresistens]MDQ0271401.1 ubiquinone/menaquinone biosynthesis C-methylase UbiE [Cytobacillus purgationiresistens]
MKQNIYDNPTFFKGYTELRDSGITYNDFLEQPAMKEAISNLEGKTILDLGCGMGGLSKYCAANGAKKVMGVDISGKMIERAEKDNRHENIQYLCQPIEELQLPSESFDLIISSLAVHYIKDYSALVATVYHLLKKGGKFVFTTEHPITTANKEMNGWITNEEGQRLHWPVDDYHEEGLRKDHWYVDGVIKYHRTISSLINTLISSGFTLEKVVEPLPTTEGLKEMPRIIHENRKPSFILIQSSK